MTSAEPALRAIALSKAYGKRLAVDHLDLQVDRGELFGFLGPNGAGKTTTIRMALGLIAPTNGSVEILGLEVRRNRSKVLPRVGALVENPALYGYLSGRNNLRAFGDLLGGVSTKRIDEVLEIVSLKGREKDKVKTYSMGMKQRLGLAVALLNDPDLLILDEPANGLDPPGEYAIQVDSPDALVAALKLQPWGQEARVEEGLVITRAPEGRGRDLIAFLVQNGHQPDSVAERQRDLEDIFLSLTGDS